MSSRTTQIVAIRQKIERLSCQLEYLEKLEGLESKQNSNLLSHTEKEQDSQQKEGK